MDPLKLLLPHAPAFQVVDHAYNVGRSVGFVGHDADRGCFMTGAPLWIFAYAGMTKKDQLPRSHGFPSFPGGNPLGITVIHTEVLFLNQPNLPCLGPFFQVDLL